MKILNAKVTNLESNLYIEIDMERLEDSSKALSFIGIEISDVLKLIPAPEENVTYDEIQEEQNINVKEVSTVGNQKINAIIADNNETNNVTNAEINPKDAAKANELEEYKEQTTFKTKTSLWQKFKNSKLVRAATYVFRIRIRIELPSNALRMRFRP